VARFGYCLLLLLLLLLPPPPPLLLLLISTPIACSKSLCSCTLPSNCTTAWSNLWLAFTNDAFDTIVKHRLGGKLLMLILSERV
jgi:hypothetical protein